MTPDMDQLTQIIGAALLLSAYGAMQLKWMRAESVAYNVFNAIGGLLLAIDAYRIEQWGFMVLEGAWGLLSLPGLWRALRPAA